MTFVQKICTGRSGGVYDPGPRAIPWTRLIRDGTPVSAQHFWTLLYAQE